MRCMNGQRVEYRTRDGVQIAGVWQQGTGNQALLCVHMMPATKESWQSFAKEATKRGFSVLAIDLRGHGESTMGGELLYTAFSDAEHEASRLDIEAALDVLASKGFSKEQVALVGASIGANLALVTLGDYPTIPLAVALSPGLNYHGVIPLSSLRALPKTQRALLIASSEDAGSYQAMERFEEASIQVEIRPVHDLGHGTRMLEADPTLTGSILDWLSSHF